MGTMGSTFDVNTVNTDMPVKCGVKSVTVIRAVVW